MKVILMAGSAAIALAGGFAQTALAQGAPTAAQVAVPANPLLADWTGPYGGVPPWDKVKPELFPEAFQFGIDEQRREFLAIANNPAPATFENTIVAMEKAGQRLDRVQTLFGVMTNNMASPAYQALDKEWSPKLSAASDEITLNPQLFQRVKAVYDARSSLGPKEQRLVTRYYESFVRNGANLDPAKKQQLTQLNQDLARAFSDFSEKVLADESKVTVATAAQLKGVPQDVKNAALAAA